MLSPKAIKIRSAAMEMEIQGATDRVKDEKRTKEANKPPQTPETLQRDGKGREGTKRNEQDRTERGSFKNVKARKSYVKAGESYVKALYEQRMLLQYMTKFWEAFAMLFTP